MVRELLTPVGSLVALLLFATIEPFVRYSAEAKQYGLDVAITLGLLYLFMRLVESGELSRWSTAACRRRTACGLLSRIRRHSSYLALRSEGSPR